MMYGGVVARLHEFLTSALDGGERKLRVPAALSPGEKPPEPTG
jgi:hypothetical protein